MTASEADNSSGQVHHPVKPSILGIVGVRKDLLGINLDVGTRRRPQHALQSVSQTASVTYKTVLDPAARAAALVDGQLPARFTPHVATLLDEAPLSLIAAAVEEVATQSHLSPKLLWKHLIAWAHALHSPREVWA